MLIAKWLCVGTLALSCTAQAAQPLSEFYDSQGASSSVENFLDAVKPGQILILSEIHDVATHHDRQMLMLYLLKSLGHKIHVGMEFLYYPQQDLANDWFNGKISERDFLTGLQWGANNFNFYRGQALFPLSTGGQLLAINAPKALTRKISREGLESLTPEEQALMPPNFALGNDLYFERFVEALGGHDGGMDPDMLRRFFAAQSTWDDTMAWKATEFMKEHPQDIMVIIVGDFHASYGGGLPDRLRQRGAEVLTLSQTNLFNVPPEDQRKEIEPHPKYGPRADFIWVSHEAEGENGQ